MNSIQFETELAQRRRELYHHPTIDIINQGFRPLSGMPADLCVIRGGGRYHFFYIERRLQEGTPFFPGNEIYFGHASTADLLTWEVHDPVLLIRPGTWEGAHVWAPFVLWYQGRYVMAYTGVNRCMSQNIGLAVSDDLFDWRRLDHNPLSPAQGRSWSFWREDGIASCRDPHLLVHADRVWMTYTANTREGASCIALTSSADLVAWEDHGPILQGPTEGYQVVTSRENPFGRGRPQGQLESSHLLSRNGRWYLLVQAHLAWSPVRNWIYESARLDAFDLAQGREFWPNAYTVEVVRDRDTRSLLACTGPIRFGVADWAQEQPIGRFINTREELSSWLD